MPIPQKIIDLTKLAISDRILTYTERRTIVDAAIKEGVSEMEINQYLDNALHQRLQSYTKEELKSCPFCGAQIPLVSETCLFCGNNLEKPTGISKLDITGYEADIIRRENLRTKQEKQNIKTCPDCGAPYPLISNICTNCGHVLHEQTDSELNIRNLINNIKQSIKEISNCPKNTYGQVIMLRIIYVCLGMAILYCIWPGFIIIIGGLLVSAGPAFLIEYVQTKENFDTLSKNQIDIQYFNAIFSMEMYIRQIETLYGSNQEAKTLLSEYAKLIDIHKEQRDKRNRKFAIKYTISIALIFLIAIIVPLHPFKNLTKSHKNDVIFKEVVTIVYIKNIKPNPEMPVDSICTKYFSIKNDAILTIDAITHRDSTITYGLNISNIELESTGERVWDNMENIHLILYDSAFNICGENLPRLSIHDMYDKREFFDWLSAHNGSLETKFSIETKPYNLDELKQNVEKVCYFSINTEP